MHYWWRSDRGGDVNALGYSIAIPTAIWSILWCFKNMVAVQRAVAKSCLSVAPVTYVYQCCVRSSATSGVQSKASGPVHHKAKAATPLVVPLRLYGWLGRFAPAIGLDHCLHCMQWLWSGTRLCIHLYQYRPLKFTVFVECT